jgi:hypothetical protein
MDTPDVAPDNTDELTASEAPTEVVSSPAAAAISPAEALERLRRGEALAGTRVVGLKLKGEFKLPIRMSNVTLVNLVIEKATFAEDVVFEHCTLDRVKVTRKSTFEKALSFAASTLVKPELRGMTVRGPFRCDNIRTRGQVVIEGARFEGRVRFWEAHFQGWVDIKACEFLDEADFRSLHAEEGFVLTGCTFRSDVLLRGATIEKKCAADTSRFEGLLDFSKAKLHDFVYLEGIEQGENQRFAFLNAVADRILVRTEQLERRLDSECKGAYAQAMQEYGLLKRNFESLHRYEAEDWALYRFKVNQRRCKARSWERPWSKVSEFCDWLLLDHGCGYGTNPFRAVRAALLIILGFAAIYAAGVASLYVEHTPFAGPATSFGNRLMIGTLTSVSAFTSGFGDIRGAAHGWMNVPLIAESLLGTLLWGLFIVAFSRKVIR